MSHRRTPRSARAARVRAAFPAGPFLLALAAVPIGAQAQPSTGTRPVAPSFDPVKGWARVAPPAPAVGLRRSEGAPPGARMLSGRDPLAERVLFDRPGDGRLWAMGAAYKASFGADGFVYVPFLGTDAPKNYPVRFALRAVRAAGRALPLADAAPELQEARVTLDRGLVREVYDLAPQHVEQSFVVDAGAGAVDLEIEVTSELQEDPARPGLQFGNDLGHVGYGTAYLVDGAARTELTTVFTGRTIALHVPARSHAGPIVVDPIISTHASTWSLNRDCANPDIAYDHGNDRFMVVFEYLFSATDTDILSEMFRGSDGAPIAGTQSPIEITTTRHVHPRVANVSDFDRFLVVMEKHDPQARPAIWGRTHNAAQPFSPSAPFQISNPAFPGSNHTPDVGGTWRVSTTSFPAQFLVAWTYVFSSVDYDIQARAVRADGTMPAPVISVADGIQQVYNNPQVSQSTASGPSQFDHWCVAYSFQFSPTDWDVYVSVFDGLAGTLVRSGGVETSGDNDLYPTVSSPVDLGPFNQAYVVTYERQAPVATMAKAFDYRLQQMVPRTNLSNYLGLGGYWARVESDGARVAVTGGDNAGRIAVGTLAIAGGAFVMQEVPRLLPGVTASPRIVSKWSGGGSRTDYGIACINQGGTPRPATVTIYHGHALGGEITRRATGCAGLGITVNGRAFLGEYIGTTLTNFGSDLAGFLFGIPGPEVPVCGGCSFGVALGGPMVIFPNRTGLAVSLPIHSLHLVFARLSIQGFAFGSGSCLGGFRFSDTIDFTVR